LTRAAGLRRHEAMHRFVIVATTLLLVGCPKRHTGGPETPSGNDLLLNRIGYPSHVTSPQRCPSPNGEGKIELSFSNGQRRVGGECRGGVMVGDWEAWYTNGATVWKSSFQHGLLQGKFRSWHANDEKMVEVAFDKGVPHGKLRAWWRNGKKRAQGEFAAGQMIGCWESWHDNGQKESKGAYAEGRKVKDWTYWSATGQKREERLGGDASQGKCGWM
jgi:antitoxin component YwqK of YwqJK toxin-antitoxin module